MTVVIVNHLQKNGVDKVVSTPPTIRVGKSADDIDDLGTLGDYEFGEFT